MLTRSGPPPLARARTRTLLARVTNSYTTTAHTTTSASIISATTITTTHNKNTDSVLHHQSAAVPIQLAAPTKYKW